LRIRSRASASTSIGRSAGPNAPIATSTRMSATSRSTPWALPGRSRARWRLAARTPGRQVASVFFGGGTPSLMPPAAVAAVLDAVAANWPVAPDVEVTLEANPTSAEAENFAGYRAAGVNRASVGVQALNDRDLKALGRQHTAEEALAAFALASQFSRAPRSISSMPGRASRSPSGAASCARRWPTSRATCRSTSSPSSPARRLPNSPRGPAAHAGRGRRRRSLRGDPGTHRARRAAGLRGFQPRRAGPPVPPQSHLLALGRLCRGGPGGAFTADGGRWPPHRPGHRAPSRAVAGHGRGARPCGDRGERDRPDRAGRGIRAHGAPPRARASRSSATQARRPTA
jgi:hypothetical protein